MKILDSVTEDVIVAEFLRGEITSERFGRTITRQLEEAGLDNKVVELPDTTDTRENALRRALLNAVRGYGSRIGLFDGFPTDVEWHSALLGRDEILNVRYINYSYWIEITAGSRLPGDAAKNISEGREVFGESNDRFVKAAEAVKRNIGFPPLILVTHNLDSPAVVLEGHLRLTGYTLAWEYLPPEVAVYIGVSASMTDWSLY